MQDRHAAAASPSPHGHRQAHPAGARLGRRPRHSPQLPPVMAPLPLRPTLAPGAYSWHLPPVPAESAIILSHFSTCPHPVPVLLFSRDHLSALWGRSKWQVSPAHVGLNPVLPGQQVGLGGRFPGARRPPRALSVRWGKRGPQPLHCEGDLGRPLLTANSRGCQGCGWGATRPARTGAGWTQAQDEAQSFGHAGSVP